MLNIGLLIIATNKYQKFIQPLISSADKYFLKNQQVTYFIFSDKQENIYSNRSIQHNLISHKEWPWMTLGRYSIFDQYVETLSKMDYLFYIDVDMLLVSDVNEEILGERVATQHPGYYYTRGTPETRKESLACVFQHEKMQYFAGGFNGGSAQEYLKMCKVLSNNINIDYSNNIIAVWHDESHMNRYFIDNPPTVILSPSYCYGEDMTIPFPKKIIALTKNHKAIR